MYLTRELFLSNAFRHLTPAAREIFILLAYELWFPQNKKPYGRTAKRARLEPTNRDSIKLPCRQIKAELGYSRTTALKAFNECMEHGFLDIVQRGGGSKNDPNVYRICEDWRGWKPGDVVRTRPKRIRKIGFQEKNKVKQG
jgi:hypothetical protein